MKRTEKIYIILREDRIVHIRPRPVPLRPGDRQVSTEIIFDDGLPEKEPKYALVKNETIIAILPIKLNLAPDLRDEYKWIELKCNK